MNYNFTVAVTAIVRNQQGHFLAIKSPDPDRGWELPGGQLDERESILDGLHREIYEESGVEVTNLNLVAVYSNNQNSRIIFSFTADYLSGELTPSMESDEVRWFEEKELKGKMGRKFILDRFEDALLFNGKILHRTYMMKPYEILNECFLSTDK